MIIDPTYFNGGFLGIPNAVNNPSITGNVPTSVSSIDSYIAKYEKELLINAIGSANYTALTQAYKADPTLAVDPLNVKWKNLVHGTPYDYDDREVVWNGLLQKNGDIKTSLIANYVFYHYLIDDHQHYTTTGMQTEKAKNALETSPNLKLVKVWRDFIELYQYGFEVCPTRMTNSWGLIGVDFYQAQQNTVRSLYQFLRDNDDYGDYTFKTYGNINRFGL